MYKHPNDLLSQLSQDVRVFLRQHTELHSAMPFTLLSCDEERTTDLHSRANENWFPYLIAALQEVPPISNGKEKFISECRKLYQNNQSALNFINEFNDTYEPHTAISWYTREGILYQLFNRTLRQSDPNRIFLYHFFIYDLNQQLRSELDKNKNADWRKEPLYRGQHISKVEIESLKNYGALYVNTFLSTTKNLELAQIYAGVGSYTSDLQSPQQPVIFTIGRSKWSFFEKSVAAIDHLSHFGDAEGEILFSPTYTFCPTAVTYDQVKAVWNVTLSQFTENYDLRYEYLQHLIKLDVFLRTSIEEETEKKYSRSVQANINAEYAMMVNHIASLIHELIVDDDDVVTMDTLCIPHNHVNVSKLDLRGIALFNNSVSPRIRSDTSSSHISMLYDCIATLFKCMGKYDAAVENYTRAVDYAGDENPVRDMMRKVTYIREELMTQVIIGYMIGYPKRHIEFIMILRPLNIGRLAIYCSCICHHMIPYLSFSSIILEVMQCSSSSYEQTSVTRFRDSIPFYGNDDYEMLISWITVTSQFLTVWMI